MTLPTALADVSKSFLVFSCTGTGHEPNWQAVGGYIYNTGALHFQRDDSPAEIVKIRWQVFEFSSGVSVERGIVDFAGTNPDSTVTISSVDTDKSFVLASLARDGSTYGTDDFLRANLTGTTTLQLDRYAGAGGDEVDSAYWEVVEFTGATVQRLTGTMANGDSYEQLPIPVPVDMDRTMVLSSHTHSANAMPQDLPYVELVTSDTVQFTRDQGDGEEDLVAYVVEFYDGTFVQHGKTTIGSGSDSVRVSLATPVDTARTGVICPGHWTREGTSTKDVNDSIGYSWFAFDLADSANLDIVRGDDGDITSTASYQLVTFEDENYTEWTSHQELYLNTKASGAGVTGDVYKFPVLVRLSGSNWPGSAASGGADIRFC
ncbi:MAG: hypothetical protein GF418_09860 [Chitinivibrionales bacterium]|nr:hypothetical protein [Chitinivibrionales bacterium]